MGSNYGAGFKIQHVKYLIEIIDNDGNDVQK